MDFYTLKFIFQISFILCLVNFIVGYPVVYLFASHKKDIERWSSVFGASIILIITGFSFYRGILKYVMAHEFHFLFLMAMLSAILILNHKNRFIHTKEIVVGEIKLFFAVTTIMIVFIIPQNTVLPYIPSYNVNHDAIGIISVAKLMYEKIDFQEFCIGRDRFLPCFLYQLNYPTGFSLYLVFFKSLFKSIDFYNLAPMISLYLYSLTIIPLSSLGYLFIKKKFLVPPAAFLSLLAYLPIQYVNQSFYSQIALTFLLFSSIYLINKIFIKQKTEWTLLLGLGLVLSAAVFIYSLTIFFWLSIFAILLCLYRLSRQDLYLRTLMGKLLILVTILVIFSSTYLLKTLNLYRNMVFKYNGTETSFFEAKGNSIGYANITTAAASWMDLDFRINTKGKLRYYSYIIFIIQLVVLLYSLHRNRRANTGNRWLFVIMILSFLVPVFVCAWILKSPYYYDKTLYYLSFIFSLIMFSVIFSEILCKNKNTITYLLAIFILIIMVNNSIKSFYYFGKPPTEKFNAINEAVGYLEKEKLNYVIAIDNEDWLKYFLVNHGSCVTYPLTYSCGLETFSTDNNGNYTLLNNNIYIIGSDYKVKIKESIQTDVLYSNRFYKIIRNRI